LFLLIHSIFNIDAYRLFCGNKVFSFLVNTESDCILTNLVFEVESFKVKVLGIVEIDCKSAIQFLVEDQKSS